MRKNSRQAWSRWLAPVAVAVLLVGGAVTATALQASAGSAALPARTAAQLLVDVEQAKLGALSGTVVQRADLGIPSIPGLASANSSDLTSLISGTHTLRVWYDGTDKARVALLGKLGESDVIKNGPDLWVWSSSNNSATHRTLPGAATSHPSLPSALLDPSRPPMSPPEAAAAVLRAVQPSTLVSTDSTGAVAGRPVYQLILRPRDAKNSLIDRVTIAIDGATHLPLRLQVFGVGTSRPAFEIAFTSVDFSKPDAAQFNFDPPPGAHITNVAPETATKVEAPTRATAGAKAAAAAVHPSVFGTGWTSVLVATGAHLPSGGQLGAALPFLPAVSGTWGSGHLLAGTIFSVLLTNSGTVAVGAVRPALLYAALAGR